MKTALLAATAVIALTAGAATGATTRPAMEVHGVTIHPMHVPPSTLYNQNSSGNGGGIDSQNFTSGTFSNTYNAAGADDFVLSANHKMKGVDASGIFYNGSGPSNGAVATLYNKKLTTVLATGTTTGGGPNYTIAIKHGIRAGKTYWLSVVSNCSFTGGCGQWGWDTRSVANNKPAEWENPGGGFGTSCTTFKPLSTCIPTYSGDDFLFDVTGK